MTRSLIIGDCREVMAGMEPESVDAIVTDPPYGLTEPRAYSSFRDACNSGRTENDKARRRGGFMGKEWDGSGVELDINTWAACLRVLKPGSHLLAFGGTRTFHRMTVAIEDAGFEIKDCLMWLHAQGFPKHKSLLKPAWEPIILAKKRGPGLLNIDACRIGTDWATDPTRRGWQGGNTSPKFDGGVAPVSPASRAGHMRVSQPNDLGRWPANVILDEVAAALLDEMSGERKSNSGKPFNRNTDKFRATYSPFEGAPAERGYYGDTGGASRFFFTAKASRSERNKGLDGMPEKMLRWSAGEQNPGSFQSDGTNKYARNHHPTVKPLDLMQWLVRLVTPPGGIVLDPFMGSGSTGIAADREGFSFIGIEMDPEYAEIARRRIIGDAPLFAEVETA